MTYAEDDKNIFQENKYFLSYQLLLQTNKFSFLHSLR